MVDIGPGEWFLLEKKLVGLFVVCFEKPVFHVSIPLD